MAHFAFVDGVATINAINLSAHCTGVDVEVRARTVEDGPCMGQADVKHLHVIKETGPVVLRFKQDFATGLVHQTVFPLWNNKTVFAYDVKPTSGADSATNPRLNGTGLVTRYRPLSGEFGEATGTEVEITPAGATPGLAEDVT